MLDITSSEPEAVVESLKLERLNVQKKTFTKWANIHLQKFGLHINDLFQDLGDGCILMKLLESLFGRKLGKPAKGNSRIKRIENISRCLMFLHSEKMRLENISSEDIVDGKPDLILGLIWTIILRHEIQTVHESDVPSEIATEMPEASDPKIAKESLLLWCQYKTKGYPRVQVRNFHRSWRDGLAFNALIHSHAPTLIDFDALKQEEHLNNLENAFSVASTHLDVPRLLDPEDVDTDKPDEKSILVYVSALNKGLVNSNKRVTGGKRIAKVINKNVEVDKMKKHYSDTATTLLQWINSKVQHFASQEQLKSLENIQKEISDFKNYRITEKPKQSERKNEIEALYFAIQMQCFGYKTWIPPENVSPAAIEKAWSQLQRAEHEHETQIRYQLKKQERLENLAYKFETKRSVREGYMNEIQKILTDPNYGASLKQSDATFKKHEAIRTGILARELMIRDLFKIAEVLIEANYRKKDDIIAWKKEAEDKWNYLLRLLEAYDERFTHLRQVIGTLEEMDSVLEEMQQLQTEMHEETEPLDISSSLQKHALKEVQVASWGEAVHRFELKVERQMKIKDINVLETQVKKLRNTYESLSESSRVRRETLEEQLRRKQQNENIEEMMAWIFEKKIYCTSDIYCKDLASALILQKKIKALGLDIKLQRELINNMGEERLKTAISQLEEQWKERENFVDLVVEAYQYKRDADECTSWISENMHLLSTLDFGTDESMSEALLRRHAHTEAKISAYSVEINSLRELCDKISSSLSKLSAVKKGETPGQDKQYSTDELDQSYLSEEYISNRQSEIENTYKELQKQCQKRKLRLQQSSTYFNFKDRCDDVEKWMREKERIMDSNDFGGETEEAEKRFEDFITDMVAHGLIIDELSSIAKQMEDGKADQAKTARILIDDVQRRWQHLNQLTKLKEKNLKGFISLLIAQRMCEESISWLNEIFKSEATLEDITSFDDLRRKQEAIDRELLLTEEKVKQARVLADDVIHSYPDQKDVIQTRVKVMEDNWEQYQIKTKERKRKMEMTANLQIFITNANSLIEWSNAVLFKLRMREKISDLKMAESMAKDHKDLGDDIEIQEERFAEIEELGQDIAPIHPETKPLLEEISQSRRIVHELWHNKQTWIRQNLDFQIFDKEANRLQLLCSSQNALLDVAELGENLSDVEIQIRHHDSLIDTLRAQEHRFFAFGEMAEKLLLDQDQKQYICERRDEILGFRENILEKANARKIRLHQEFQLQEFKADVQEMLFWIAEKSKRALELLQSDVTKNLSYKIKRLESLEAELLANQNRLQSIYAKGEKLSEECSFAREGLEKILEDLENAWNLLCERIDINRQTLYQAKELNGFYTCVEYAENKLDEIKRFAESSYLGNEPRSVNNLLKKQDIMESEKEKLKEKVSNLVNQGQKLIDEMNCDEQYILNLITQVKRKLEATEEPLASRREKLETCSKFHQYKSEVERELMWISDHIASLTAISSCKSLVEAQRLQKKLENLEVTLECHQKIVENLSKEVLVLVAEKECIVDITKTCEEMQSQWNNLLGLFSEKKEEVNFIAKVQMFYSEANEIDSWVSEKKRMLSSTDYGSDEDHVIKLLTKHKDIELEIHSYQGLVDELTNQADALIKLNNADSKIVKNRMEIIDQDMKNLQTLCSIRRQKLLESKTQREFEKETEELDLWINEQISQATSEDYGNDYEHVLLLHSNFEFYRGRVKAGSKRIMQYEDFAKRLIDSKCSFIENVKESLEHLSSRWSELLEILEARAFKLEAAGEIHRYHRDVTDIMARIHSYYRALPSDLGSSLAHAQQLAKKHDATENELLGIEAQVHLLLEDSQRLQETYPGGNEEHIQMQLALVVENWNMLQQKIASRKASLIASQRIHKFFSMVREEENWSKQMCFELQSDNIPRDVEQMANQHHITQLEIETRLAKYEYLKNDGESLLVYDLFHPQIDEKLQALSEIHEKVEKAWKERCELVEIKKAAILFFNEAKLIQASIATKEIQLCGSETKETVEDLQSALRKHAEFQRTMGIHEEKFFNWEQQGKILLEQKVPESERIQKKLEELSSRRKRLLNFSKERCETHTNALQLAKFKRDTIEVEAWIKEKKNKLRVFLKDYNQLNAEEKIKCLRKQQSLQAEIESHESIIQRIIQQKKEIPHAGEELNVRVELILENWNDIKSSSAQMGRDLKEAQDMLIMHDYFEKAEDWLKEKELLIQKNDVGKDYEHCVVLQTKLNDYNSSTKIDEAYMQRMKELAEKLSRQENQNGVYVRYERVNERWNYLKEEIALYRKKLSDAAEVHAFIKDVDETIDRIREKLMILSARDEVHELTVAEMMRRKLEATEQDLTAIDKKIKEQCATGKILEECHQLSAGRINDKIMQVNREWTELKREMEQKKKHMNDVYNSLKFIKDVEDMENIVNEIITEMEHGDIPSDSADAISYLQAHNDYQIQIEACQKKIKSLEEYGEKVLRIPGVLVEEVNDSVKFLAQMSKSIQMSWTYRLNLLTQYRDVQIFTEKAKQTETWFASKEAFLANQDVGDSMSSVEALIRKQENFEKSCFGYFDKIHELEALASNLSHYEDCQDIKNWFEEICERRVKLEEDCESRKKVLEDSKALQQMLLHIYEVSNWMNEKIQIVSDNSYRDLTNLLSKTQKHATLEAEILANHSRVVSINKQADEMLQNAHFASDEIKQHIQNLEDLWQKLMDLTNEQKYKLNDAYNALKFKQKLEDINNWLDETEAQLQFINYANDVASIQQEIDKLKEIEKETEECRGKLKILNEASEKFNHSTKEEILNVFKSTTERFQYFEDFVVERFAKLQEELLLADLEKDINDELSWIEENIAVCQSEEYFNDVVSVQVMQKKLQALETEMLSREPLIVSIVERGSRLDNSNEEIKVKYLNFRFQELKDSISLRRLRLSDALEAQTYYFEIAQAEIWIKEKMAQVSNCESDLDLYSVQEMKKKIGAIEAATNGYKQNITSIEERCADLVGRGHYDSNNIRMKQEELNNRYEQLNCSILKKIAILREEEEFSLFQRDVNILMSQLRSMSNITNNTDVGRDVEHVESLLQKLEIFRNKQCSHEQSMKDLQKRACGLIEGGHTESSKIQQLLTELEDTWLECDYSAEARFKALEQAKQIHLFNKSADETISWIHEKDVALSSENYGHDLQSIKMLLRHHETLEGDLKAIQEQVEALKNEVATLASHFSDSKDLLEEKCATVTEAWENCTEKAINRKEKLLQAEQMQSYFDEARDFHAWIREMSAMITRADLPQDVAACEAILAYHDGYKSDIDAQLKSFRLFENRGHEIITSGHFMAQEVETKLQNLNTSFEKLLSIWQERKETHEQNLDLQLFRKKLKELESWLQGHEHYLYEEDGRSLEEVDYLIQKHNQLEEKLRLYEAKFEELQKTTKIEKEIMQKKEMEEEKKRQQEKLSEQKKLEEIKRQAEEKLLQERRIERSETEKTQEKDQPDDDFHDDYLPHDDVPPEKQFFKRIDSTRSFREQPAEMARPQTPVIQRRNFSVSRSLVPTTKAEGFLERKQEFLGGGKRSTSRGWKTYYTVLCGQLLCFFKDKRAFLDQNAAKPPINILGARCSLPKDYHKRKYVFRLEPSDDSSYLFEAPNEIKRDEWLQKINFTASLPPSKQLVTSTEELISEEPRTERFTEEKPTSNNPLYHDVPQNIDSVHNPIYAVPHEYLERSDTVTSYDDALHSARSSISNQSSYRTALASASSISTLQDEQVGSSDDDFYSSMPEPVTRTKSEISVDPAQHEKVMKQMSLPRQVEAKRTPSKKRWKVFSLRR